MVLVLPQAALIVGLFGLLQPAMRVSSAEKTALLTGLTLAGAVSLPLVLLAAGRLVSTRRVVEWSAVRLTVRGRETELFRTRAPEWAAEVVDAINRAIAART